MRTRVTQKRALLVKRGMRGCSNKNRFKKQNTGGKTLETMRIYNFTPKKEQRNGGGGWKWETIIKEFYFSRWKKHHICIIKELSQ